MKEAFELHHKEKKEPQKVDLLQTIRKLLQEYYAQNLKAIEAN
jgi:hypothetical protein